MKPTIGLNLRVTGHCNQGGRKYMEDAFVVGYQQSENLKELVYAYFGIFDGHGGKEAALYAKENLMNNIVKQKGFWSDDDSKVLKAIRDGFLETHHAMWQEVGNWPKTVSGLPSTSGTTSSIAFIRKGKLYIGHVGDSKIVLGSQQFDGNDWYAQALTKDHKPESPEEKERINSAGGLVLKKSGVQRVVWNRPQPGHQGPIRRSTPVELIPFLAVSRSLGDLWSFNYITNEFVVSPDPDVQVFKLNPKIHRCIIFGSDGLWNMMQPHTAVKIVQKVDEENEKIILEGGKEKQSDNPSRLLVDTAIRYWFNCGMRADNISVVTVMLDPPGPCKREVLLKKRVMKRLRPRDEHCLNEEDDDDKSPVLKETHPLCMKDKKRTSEYIDSPKEGRLSEPPCKKRKLSKEISELSVPKNLPKPVILSPLKIVKPKSSPPPAAVTPVTNDPSNVDKCDATLATTKPSDANPTPTTDAKVKKKDPSDGDSVAKTVETENDRKSSPSSSHFHPEHSSDKIGESSKNECCENSKEQQTILPLVGKNNLVPKTEKSEGSYPAAKENGRVHLCEVDNIFKLNDRTSDCNESRNGKSKDLQKTRNVVAAKEKNFRKTTLTSRNSTVNKKSITLRKPQLQTMCRTRAQSNIQKLKV